MQAVTSFPDRPRNWIVFIFMGWLFSIALSVLPDLWQSPFSLVQDDGRHFVVWLRKLAHPELFPNDAIADYFTALTPFFYKVLYWPAVFLAIDPIIWEFLVVAPLASLLFTISAYRLLAHFFSTTHEAGLATLILCSIFISSPIVGLPRSFAFSILFFALTAFIEKRRILLIVTMFVGANIYPISAIMAGATMGIFALFQGRVLLQKAGRADLLRVLLAALAGVIGLAIFAIFANDQGPTFTLKAATQLPIFHNGRSNFFYDDLIYQVVCGSRAGLLHRCIRSNHVTYPILSVAVFFIMIGAGYAAYRWIIMRQLDNNGSRLNLVLRLTLSLLIAGLALFALSYLVAFKAHLPERYATLSIRLLDAFAKIVFTLSTWRILSKILKTRFNPKWNAPIFAIICLAIWIGTFARKSAIPELFHDKEPQISAFLRASPVKTRIAGFHSYVDGIPAFTSRSVFASLELLIPYKVNYYRLIQHRVNELRRIYDAPFNQDTIDFVEKNAIDFFIVSRNTQADMSEWDPTFPSSTISNQPHSFKNEMAGVLSCISMAGVSINLIDARCLVQALQRF